MAFEFLVVVPTIRRSLPGFEEAVAQTRASFTRPTDFHILDGSLGKVAALNKAFDELLLPSAVPVYVTLDDDIGLLPGWQEPVQACFAALPEVGICSTWPGETQEHLELVGASGLPDWKVESGVEVRNVPWPRHIPGGLLAFRREAALAVGKQPATGLHYEVYEDAWRGRVAAKAGWRSVYVRGPGWEMLKYEDNPAYLKQKAEDLARSRGMTESVFRAAGISDPWVIRCRRWLARVRGRAKD